MRVYAAYGTTAASISSVSAVPGVLWDNNFTWKPHIELLEHTTAEERRRYMGSLAEEHDPRLFEVLRRARFAQEAVNQIIEQHERQQAKENLEEARKAPIYHPDPEIGF